MVSDPKHLAKLFPLFLKIREHNISIVGSMSKEESKTQMAFS